MEERNCNGGEKHSDGGEKHSDGGEKHSCVQLCAVPERSTQLKHLSAPAGGVTLCSLSSYMISFICAGTQQEVSTECALCEEACQACSVMS